MAICDATELALRLSTATNFREAFLNYEEFRRSTTSETVLLSRHLGLLRQGLTPNCPQNGTEWGALTPDQFAKLAADGRVFKSNEE